MTLFTQNKFKKKTANDGGAIPASFPRVCFTDYIYHMDCGSFIVIRINQKIERSRQIGRVKRTDGLGRQCCVWELGAQM